MPRSTGKRRSAGRIRGKAAAAAARRLPARKSIARKAPVRGQGRPPGKTLGREAVLRAVCRLLKTRSYGEVTLSAVARDLKVDPALIRYYYSSHDALMEAAGLTLKEEFRAYAIAAVARSDGSPEGLLRARIAALITIGSRYRFATRLLTDLANRNPRPNVRKAIYSLTHEGREFYERVLTAGVHTGRLRQVEPLFLTMAVLGLADVFSIQEPIFKAGRRLGVRSTALLRRRYEQFIGDLVLNGLKAR